MVMEHLHFSSEASVIESAGDAENLVNLLPKVNKVSKNIKHRLSSGSQKDMSKNTSSEIYQISSIPKQSPTSAQNTFQNVETNFMASCDDFSSNLVKPQSISDLDFMLSNIDKGETLKTDKYDTEVLPFKIKSEPYSSSNASQETEINKHRAAVNKDRLNIPVKTSVKYENRMTYQSSNGLEHDGEMFPALRDVKYIPEAAANEYANSISNTNINTSTVSVDTPNTNMMPNNVSNTGNAPHNTSNIDVSDETPFSELLIKSYMLKKLEKKLRKKEEKEKRKKEIKIMKKQIMIKEQQEKEEKEKLLKGKELEKQNDQEEKQKQVKENNKGKQNEKKERKKKKKQKERKPESDEKKEIKRIRKEKKKIEFNSADENTYYKDEKLLRTPVKLEDGEIAGICHGKDSEARDLRSVLEKKGKFRTNKFHTRLTGSRELNDSQKFVDHDLLHNNIVKWTKNNFVSKNQHNNQYKYKSPVSKNKRECRYKSSFVNNVDDSSESIQVTVKTSKRTIGSMSKSSGKKQNQKDASHAHHLHKKDTKERLLKGNRLQSYPNRNFTNNFELESNESRSYTAIDKYSGTAYERQFGRPHFQHNTCNNSPKQKSHSEADAYSNTCTVNMEEKSYKDIHTKSTHLVSSSPRDTSKIKSSEFEKREVMFKDGSPVKALTIENESAQLPSSVSRRSISLSPISDDDEEERLVIITSPVKNETSESQSPKSSHSQCFDELQIEPLVTKVYSKEAYSESISPVRGRSSDEECLVIKVNLEKTPVTTSTNDESSVSVSLFKNKCSVSVSSSESKPLVLSESSVVPPVSKTSFELFPISKASSMDISLVSEETESESSDIPSKYNPVVENMPVTCNCSSTVKANEAYEKNPNEDKCVIVDVNKKQKPYCEIHNTEHLLKCKKDAEGKFVSKIYIGENTSETNFIRKIYQNEHSRNSSPTVQHSPGEANRQSLCNSPVSSILYNKSPGRKSCSLSPQKISSHSSSPVRRIYYKSPEHTDYKSISPTNDFILHETSNKKMVDGKSVKSTFFHADSAEKMAISKPLFKNKSQRSISPHKRSISPYKRSISPHKRSISPHKRSISPHKRSISPHIVPSRKLSHSRSPDRMSPHKSFSKLSRSSSPRKMSPHAKSYPRNSSRSKSPRRTSPRNRSHRKKSFSKSPKRIISHNRYIRKSLSRSPVRSTYQRRKSPRRGNSLGRHSRRSSSRRRSPTRYRSSERKAFRSISPRSSNRRPYRSISPRSSNRRSFRSISPSGRKHSRSRSVERVSTKNKSFKRFSRSRSPDRCKSSYSLASSARKDFKLRSRSRSLSFSLSPPHSRSPSPRYRSLRRSTSRSRHSRSISPASPIDKSWLFESGDWLDKTASFISSIQKSTKSSKGSSTTTNPKKTEVTDLQMVPQQKELNVFHQGPPPCAANVSYQSVPLPVTGVVPNNSTYQSSQDSFQPLFPHAPGPDLIPVINTDANASLQQQYPTHLLPEYHELPIPPMQQLLLPPPPPPSFPNVPPSEALTAHSYPPPLIGPPLPCQPPPECPSLLTIPPYSKHIPPPPLNNSNQKPSVTHLLQPPLPQSPPPTPPPPPLHGPASPLPYDTLNSATVTTHSLNLDIPSIPLPPSEISTPVPSDTGLSPFSSSTATRQCDLSPISVSTVPPPPPPPIISNLSVIDASQGTTVKTACDNRISTIEENYNVVEMELYSPGNSSDEEDNGCVPNNQSTSNNPNNSIKNRIPLNENTDKTNISPFISSLQSKLKNVLPSGERLLNQKEIQNHLEKTSCLKQDSSDESSNGIDICDSNELDDEFVALKLCKNNTYLSYGQSSRVYNSSDSSNHISAAAERKKETVEIPSSENIARICDQVHSLEGAVHDLLQKNPMIFDLLANVSKKIHEHSSDSSSKYGKIHDKSRPRTAKSLSSELVESFSFKNQLSYSSEPVNSDFSGVYNVPIPKTSRSHSPKSGALYNRNKYDNVSPEYLDPLSNDTLSPTYKKRSATVSQTILSSTSHLDFHPKTSRPYSPKSGTSYNQNKYDNLSSGYLDLSSNDTLSTTYKKRSAAAAQTMLSPTSEVEFRSSSQEIISPVSNSLQSSSPAHISEYMKKYDSNSKCSSLYRRRSTTTAHVCSMPTSPITIPTSPADFQTLSQALSPSFSAHAPDYIKRYDSSFKPSSVYQKKSPTTAKTGSVIIPTSPIMTSMCHVNPSQETILPLSPTQVGDMKKYDPSSKHSLIYQRRSTITAEVTSVPTSPVNFQSPSQGTMSSSSPAHIPVYMKKFDSSSKHSSMSLPSMSYNKLEDGAHKTQKDISHSFKSTFTEKFDNPYGVSASHESRYAIESSSKQNKASHSQKKNEKIVLSSKQQSTELTDSTAAHKNLHVHSRINRYSLDDHEMTQQQCSQKVSIDNRLRTRASLSSLDDDNDNNKYNTAGCRMQDVMQYIRQKLESDLRESSVTSRVYKPVQNSLPTNLDAETSSELNLVVPEILEINEEVKTPVAEFSDDSQTSVICLDSTIDNDLSDNIKEIDKNTKKTTDLGCNIDKSIKKKKSSKHQENPKRAQMTDSEDNKNILEGSTHKTKDGNRNNKKIKQCKIYDESAEMLFSVNPEPPPVITINASADCKASNNTVSTTKATEKIPSKTRKQAAPKRWSTVCSKSVETIGADAAAEEKNNSNKSFSLATLNESEKISKISISEPMNKVLESNDQCSTLVKNNLECKKPDVSLTKVSLEIKKHSDDNKLITENSTSTIETQTKPANKKVDENLTIKPVIILTDITLDKKTIESKNILINNNSENNKTEQKKNSLIKTNSNSKNGENLQSFDFNVSKEKKRSNKKSMQPVHSSLDDKDVGKKQYTDFYSSKKSKKGEKNKNTETISDNSNDDDKDDDSNKEVINLHNPKNCEKPDKKKKSKSFDDKKAAKEESDLPTCKKSSSVERKKHLLIQTSLDDGDIRKNSFNSNKKSKRTDEVNDTETQNIFIDNKKDCGFTTASESKETNENKAKGENEKTLKEEILKLSTVKTYKKVIVKENNLLETALDNDKTQEKKNTDLSKGDKKTSKVGSKQLNVVSDEGGSDKKKSFVHTVNEISDKVDNQTLKYSENKTGNIETSENTTCNEKQKRIVLHMKRTVHKKAERGGEEESSSADSSLWEALSETLPNCTALTCLYQKHVSVLKSFVGNPKKHKLTRNDYKLRWVPTIKLTREVLNSGSVTPKNEKCILNTSSSSNDSKANKVEEIKKRSTLSSKEIELVEISDSSDYSEFETMCNKSQVSDGSSTDIEIVSSSLNVKNLHKKPEYSSTKDRIVLKSKRGRITESEESSDVEIVSPLKLRKLKNRSIESSSEDEGEIKPLKNRRYEIESDKSGSDNEIVTKPLKRKRLETDSEDSTSDIKILTATAKQSASKNKKIESSSEDEIITKPLKKEKLEKIPKLTSKNEILLTPSRRKRFRKESEDSSSEDKIVTKSLKNKRLKKALPEKSSYKNRIVTKHSEKRCEKLSDDSSSEDEILCQPTVKKRLHKKAKSVTPLSDEDDDELTNLELPFVETEVYKQIISLLSVHKRSVSIQVSPTNTKKLSGSINVKSEDNVKKLYTDIIENLKNLVTSTQNKAK